MRASQLSIVPEPEPQFNQEMWSFAILFVLLYSLVLSLPMAHNGWDPSRYIVAGDRYVDAANVPSPIQVRRHSDGYDGQFYYRLALDPWTSRRTDHGVTIDSPAWRQQRIGYPVATYLLSFGQPALVPYALLILNLLCVGVLAFVVRLIQNRMKLPAWFSWAVMLWPGLIVTLTHDTTEIVALALLSATISAYLSDRAFLYAILAVFTTLTRETSIILFGGIFLYESLKWLKSPRRADTLRLFMLASVALPYLVWWYYLTLRWGASPQQSGNGGNMGIPFAGIAQTLLDCVSGTRPFSPSPIANPLHRIALASVASAILASGVLVVRNFPMLFRRADRLTALTVGWLILALILSTLTGARPHPPGGPWVDATAAFRAFSEYWLITVLILASTRLRIQSWLAVSALAVWGVTVVIMV
jgi:hypothetical protein